jgi:predicted transcriptional regulator of viral defense system
LSIHKISISRALEERLAAENRRILSEWRAVVLLRRASREIAESSRRWVRTPQNPEEIRPILMRLCQSGELKSIEQFPSLYLVTAPYARSEAADEVEILMELQPLAALSHVSALAFHQMTEELPKEIHVSVPSDGSSGLLPVGTDGNDWSNAGLVRGSMPDAIADCPIHWHRLVSKRIFGMAEYDDRGFPVRVTTPERTLLDGLVHPEWSGGFTNVLKAWAAYRDLANVETIVQYVDRFGIAVLRQRVGFLLEQLHLAHPALAQWTLLAHRGGSSKLNGGAAFASKYDERWQLSINAPLDPLFEEQA